MTPSLHQFKKLRRRLPKEMLKARYSIHSSASILEYRRRYLEHFAAVDEDYFRKQVVGLNLFRGPNLDTPKGQQMQRLMDEYGLRSWGVWRVPVKYHPDWYVVFVIFSKLERELLNERLMPNLDEIDHQLLLYTSLFNDHCIAQINPITNFSCLSDKALRVLKMTAAGRSSDEIGAELQMSENGVNYHLDRFKELFHARNRAQLISLSHTLGLLN
ncbi:helix-turn-helix transcriptional regulator [Ferrimonas sediminicola]|uniref:helix-turn-helix transcriptional regulator n=1 Tax=Ferrimonas sediminicola TaxID=2569538 RepID=UPI001E60EC73|nr:helix-turn-helix transcriptional regulator [Ferrimonas sediminicola]